MKRYGPYFHKATGYFYYVDIGPGGRRVTYVHRDVVEKREGRRLARGEIVHHANEKKTDNADGNLKITSPSAHGKMHARRPATVTLLCRQCSREFERTARWERAYRRKREDGPFCSGECAGRRRRGTKALPHGTDSGYTYHRCRCERCRAAHADAARNSRR